MTSRKRSLDAQIPDNGFDSHAKKPKVNAENSKVDANGDKYWEISKKRRVTLSEFRNNTLINIREYYDKDGQELPGKKGISMSVDQFAALVTLLPDIEQALSQKGVAVPRPDYSGVSGHSDGDGNQDKASSPSKQNIEATSDEDEGEV
ncbi:hypothetical protein N7492_002152 [Penicillium capsulatum]|uniref:Transcriptional coactivator p15 (PC4) C-terminal domain-containing protein n=1 Tax=Penicillium capsulatum TaxID=69766 RepID=A0A9W9LW34_9EURO|nr:hypothetical protein N7492_002152 [Penicillium capsulatum]KAJ6123238.1 hypothetical protein N7512_005703 [Penicillium capsulatum]